MKENLEHITCGKLWKRYHDASIATRDAKNHLDNIIMELHKTETRLDYVGGVYKNLYENAGITRLKRMRSRRGRIDITHVTYEGKLALSKHDYLELIQHRKDLNILITYYKKEWHNVITRMNRYLMAYREVLEYAKSINNDAHFISEYPVAIRITNTKLGKFDVLYDKLEDGEYHKIIHM